MRRFDIELGTGFRNFCDDGEYIAFEDHEAECATLRDKLEVARAERDTVYEKLNEARAEVEERKTERTEYARAYAAAGSSLAAATELLELARDAIDEACWPVWWEKWRAFLAAQPAAAARTEAAQGREWDANDYLPDFSRQR